MLEAGKGAPVSGEAIASALGCSRTAVWKAITELKEAGYPIQAATRRGYLLAETSDILSAAGIRASLGEAAAGLTIEVFPSIDSTNAEARRRVAAAASASEIPFATILIAEEQTAGRGRRSKSFFSPAAGSLYVSFVLRPLGDTARTRMVTMAAAVAVCEAMAAFGAGVPEIKWVNDIYMEGKKVCGILTEAISDVESGGIEAIILGIGVNVNVPAEAFPAELRRAAGSITLAAGQRNAFAAALIRRVLARYAMPAADVVEAYRARSMMMGRQISVSEAGEERRAEVMGIGDDGSLLVRYADGGEAALLSVEITLL